MRLKLLMTAVVLVVAALAMAMAQTIDEPAALDDDPDRPPAGQVELAALAPPSLGLGADLGNACVCMCRKTTAPQAGRWAYYERSIVSGCQWTGRVCVVEGALGTLGACTESAAPLN